MLDADALADLIKAALGSPVDKDGAPVATTAEMKKYAEAVLTLADSTFVHTLVTATGAPVSPITAGAALGGLLVGFTSGPWLGIMTAAFPTANAGQLSSEASASVGYLNGATLVNFSSGKITGLCTATTEAPGILDQGAGQDGEIAGIDGSAWNTVVMSALGGGGPLGAAVYQAISDYLLDNVVAEYATGSVTGTFASGGGPLIGGIGAGGTFQ